MAKQMETFVPGEEDWESYEERLQQHFIVNKINTDREKRAMLISSIGKSVYATLKNLSEPARVADQPYDELVLLLKGHFSPEPSVIAERHAFHRSQQNEGESVQDFVVRLRRLTRACEFGTFLDSALRDQLVTGLRNSDIVQALYREDKALSFDKAIKIAVAHEQAAGNAAAIASANGSNMAVSIKQNVATVDVHRVQQQQQRAGSGEGGGGQSYRKPRPQSGSSQQTAEVSNKQNVTGVICYCCGRGNHKANTCRFRGYRCNNCNRVGHLKVMCPNLGVAEAGKAVHSNYILSENVELEEQQTDYLPIFHHEGGHHTEKPWFLSINVNGRNIDMEIDTGSAISAVSESYYKNHFASLGLPLLPTKVRLRSYVNGIIEPLGIVKVLVSYKDTKSELQLFVVPNGGPPLLGRDWYRALNFPVPFKQVALHSVETVGVPATRSSVLEGALKDFQGMFDGGLGTFNKFKVDLKVKEGSKSVFCAPRPLAFALKSKVDSELDRLLRLGIIYPVEFSNWATPIVPVAKYNGTVRICGDYKVTLNPCLEVERYPLPRVEELFAKLGGGKKFSKIDLSQAFQQLQLEDSSQELVTINTHRGLFRYCRLPFGVTPAPSIFQRTMDQALQGLKGVVCFQDDLLVTGNDDDEHSHNLKCVLERLFSLGFKVNKEKCSFMVPSVEFLGHRVDGSGLHTTNDKVEAVEHAPRPENVSQLRSFLGLVDYYAKFLPRLSILLAPLHELLQKNRSWCWSPQCEESFNTVKMMLISSPVLVHYDPELPIKLACDASPYGLGAAISHVYPNGDEKPVAFASRSLSSAERNYSQLDREALAIIFGVRKFTQYLYGRRFVLATDHKPLVYIFGEKKGIPQLAANRLQRWAVILQGFDYEIQYVPAKEHCNVDGLSRLPLPCIEAAEEFSYLDIGEYEFLPVTAKDIKMKSEYDPILSKVLEYCRYGWPNEVDEDFRPYFARKEQLNIEQGCLMWGCRVVVPHSLRKQMLNELHMSHFGAAKMKSLARSYIWWPKLDADIESITKSCDSCLTSRQMPVKSVLHPWDWPSGPWERLHIDLAGPFMGKMFLVIIDSYSKWPEVFELKSSTSEAVLHLLRNCFAMHGLPLHIVSDNGTQFSSEEFSLFCKHNGIKHSFAPPYHPASNGAAENMVKTFKGKIKTLVHSGIVLDKALPRFLLGYRITPHSTTGEPPCQLLLGRSLRSRLTLVRPNLREKVTGVQETQIRRKQGRLAVFAVGDTVMTRDYRRNGTWVTGVVKEVLGPLTYIISTGEGLEWVRHVDQVVEHVRKFPEVVNPPCQQDIGGQFSNLVDQDRGFLQASAVSSCDGPKVTQRVEGSDNDGNMLETETCNRYPKRLVKPRQVLDL